MTQYWCGHCQDNYPTQHYGDDDCHLVGVEYGPAGADLALRAKVKGAVIVPLRWLAVIVIVPLWLIGVPLWDWLRRR